MSNISDEEIMELTQQISEQGIDYIDPYDDEEDTFLWELSMEKEFLGNDTLDYIYEYGEGWIYDYTDNYNFDTDYSYSDTDFWYYDSE